MGIAGIKNHLKLLWIIPFIAIIATLFMYGGLLRIASYLLLAYVILIIIDHYKGAKLLRSIVEIMIVGFFVFYSVINKQTILTIGFSLYLIYLVSCLLREYVEVIDDEEDKGQEVEARVLEKNEERK